MSALLANASAAFVFNGASINLTASSPEELLAALAKFGLTPAANETKPADTKAKADPKPQADKPKAEAGNAPASTATPGTAQGAASGSESAAEGKRPTYDDVKARVLALAKIGRDKATAALAKFGVDHGNKLKLEDYPAFIAHADEVLGAKGA